MQYSFDIAVEYRYVMSMMYPPCVMVLMYFVLMEGHSIADQLKLYLISSSWG
jgi:hypothetical protein